MNFQLTGLNTVILIKNAKGNIIKISRHVPKSFYHMTLQTDGFYFDSDTNHYYQKNVQKIKNLTEYYYQEEYNDITSLFKKNKQLSDNLRRDPLTHIPNIIALEDMKQKIISTGRNCVFVMCDINDFKVINDNYGHISGDNALVEIANLFKPFVQEKKSTVARIGGDEFLFVFVTDCVTSVMESMHLLQEKVIKLGDAMQLPLSVSMGISTFQYGDDWDLKRKEADSALYYVKNSYDKNQLAYWDSEKGKPMIYPSTDFQRKIGVKPNRNT